MRDFSAGAAIGAGFRLIGREPLAFLAWALVYLVVGLLPQVWMFSRILPMLGEFAASAESGGEPAMQDMMRLQMQIMQLQPLSYLASILSAVLIMGAVNRAVLMPDERRFLYLRLGMRELWLGLSWLVLMVLLVLGVIVLLIPVIVAVGVTTAGDGGGEPSGAGILIAVLLGFAALGVGAWAALRLSMGPLMSFAENTFRIFESWRFTRGLAMKMFGVGLALVLIMFVAQMALGAAAFAFVLGAVLQNASAGAMEGDPLAALRAISPAAIAVGCVLFALLYAFSHTLMGAAWADIYRQLTARADTFD